MRYERNMKMRINGAGAKLMGGGHPQIVRLISGSIFRTN